MRCILINEHYPTSDNWCGACLGFSEEVVNQEGGFRGTLDQGKGPMYRTIYSEVLLYQVDKESIIWGNFVPEAWSNWYK